VAKNRKLGNFNSGFRPRFLKSLRPLASEQNILRIKDFFKKILVLFYLLIPPTPTPSYGLDLLACSNSEFFSEIMNHRQTVGLLGRVISLSQGLHLHRTTQHRQTRTNIHALSGIRTRDPVYERLRPAPQTARPLDRSYLFKRA
jgi:hypothetical protein